ncbi:hypothetical protein DFH27DRAFT_22660 [Peziza echinospora]|nr:hypothetical protein DFH27DRAFT_22660 [Peziza echinospora]
MRSEDSRGRGARRTRGVGRAGGEGSLVVWLPVLYCTPALHTGARPVRTRTTRRSRGSAARTARLRARLRPGHACACACMRACCVRTVRAWGWCVRDQARRRGCGCGPGRPGTEATRTRLDAVPALDRRQPCSGGPPLETGPTARPRPRELIGASRWAAAAAALRALGTGRWMRAMIQCVRADGACVRTET